MLLITYLILHSILVFTHLRRVAARQPELLWSEIGHVDCMCRGGHVFAHVPKGALVL